MIHKLKNNYKKLLVIFHDYVMSVVAQIFAFLIRYEFSLDFMDQIPLVTIVVISSVIHLITFLTLGLYKGLWRYSSTIDLLKIIQASSAGIGFSTIGIFVINRLENFPRSVLLINWFLLICLLGGGRFFYRLWKESKQNQKQNTSEFKKILIIGAGHAGEQLSREIQKNPRLKYKIAGFIDDDPNKTNKTLLGISILGQTHEISEIAKRKNIKTAFIAIPSADSAQIRRIVNFCVEANM
ncbi:MAG: hypothetical protein CMK92_06015, partial [Pseudomonas sp.]|nr:hypothetical protein [Pseudomonas sp.]